MFELLLLEYLFLQKEMIMNQWNPFMDKVSFSDLSNHNKKS